MVSIRDVCEHVFVRSDEEYQTVLQMLGTGRSDYEIARRTGVPRSTVQKWRSGKSAIRRRYKDHTGWRPSDAFRYCYALGLYLGDGHIVVRNERPSFLRIFLDAKYPQLNDEAADALGTTFQAPVHRYDWGEVNRVILQLSHGALLAAFPQHGPGRKHERSIVLHDWQLELTHAHPDALIRGLIHSDGCRTINRFTTKLPSGRVKEYAYPRYFFTNLSTDILEIFREHCALLGVRCTLSNHRNLSVSHKKSVAILDEVVGPKR